jgi:MFS transporter, DHA2 family, multidrug resistance protein
VSAGAGALGGASTAAAMSSRARWAVAFAVLLPTIMEVLDTAIVNVALPYMAASLSADLDEITWVLTSYLVANAIVLPLTFWLSRMFGRKPFLLGCIALFTAASALCATATTLSAMVVYRALQGAAGGALQPLSQAILLESFPEQERGSAMAAWGMGIVVAPVVAPLLGGWLTQDWSWHWIFLVNIPVGAAALLAVQALVHDPPHARRQPVPVDAAGIALLVVGIDALQVVLDRGQVDDWFDSSRITALAVASAVGLVLFLIQERRSRHPVVDLSVFRERSFSAGCGAMFLFGFALYATLALIPLFLQGLLGYGAIRTGETLAPRGLGVMASMGIAGRLLRRWDARRVMLMGPPFLIASSLLLARVTLDTSSGSVAEIMVVQGVGLGFVFVPLATATLARIADARLASATGTFNLLRNLGGSVGIAVSQTLLARALQRHHAVLAEHASRYDFAFQHMRRALEHQLAAQAATPAQAARQALAAISRGIEAQAAVLAYEDVFRVFVAVFVLLLVLIAFMRTGGGQPGPPREPAGL